MKQVKIIFGVIEFTNEWADVKKITGVLSVPMDKAEDLAENVIQYTGGDYVIEDVFDGDILYLSGVSDFETLVSLEGLV